MHSQQATLLPFTQANGDQIALLFVATTAFHFEFLEAATRLFYKNPESGEIHRISLDSSLHTEKRVFSKLLEANIRPSDLDINFGDEKCVLITALSPHIPVSLTQATTEQNALLRLPTCPSGRELKCCPLTSAVSMLNRRLAQFKG
jgi:hypothetical protein